MPSFISAAPELRRRTSFRTQNAERRTQNKEGRRIGVLPSAICNLRSAIPMSLSVMVIPHSKSASHMLAEPLSEGLGGFVCIALSPLRVSARLFDPWSVCLFS